MYQRLSRPPISLFDEDSETKRSYLDIISGFLKPVSEMGSGKANRMVYCLATDYLALVHHKKATKALGAIIGMNREYYLDNSGDFDLLSSLLSDKTKTKEKVNDLNSIVNHFSTAARLFDGVVKCQDQLQKEEHNEGYRYIWKGYALYNQARCEFMIHLIESLANNVNSSKFISKEDHDLALLWEENMRTSVISRKENYVYFNKRPLFPRFITFNLQAEYYHAFYEYELSSFIKFKIDPNYEPKSFVDYQKFQDWKNANLAITDVLSVDAKVSRLNKLKEVYFDSEIESLVSNIADENKRKDIIEKLQPMKKAAIDEDVKKFNKITKGFEIEPELGLEFTDGQIPKFIARIRGKVSFSKETTGSC